MNNDATIYSIYLGYMGRKGSLMDTASAHKASSLRLQDDEIVYTMVTLGKLYAFAGYLPVGTNLKEKEVWLKSDKDEVVIDIDNIVTAKDRSMALLQAVSCQSAYNKYPDRVRGVMDDLDLIYKDGKDFNSLINRYVSGKALGKEKLSEIKVAIQEFLKIFADAVEHYDRNIIHLSFSEVLEDIDDMIRNKE